MDSESNEHEAFALPSDEVQKREKALLRRITHDE